MGGPRRTFLGWMVAAAAAVFLAGSYGIARSFTSTKDDLRTEHARGAAPIPPEMMVVVAEDGKLFHGGAACPFIHDKTKVRTIAARDALLQGYTPCVRCMKKYVS